jgi:colicin import membrane protein
VLIHGLAAALVVFFSYAANRASDDTPKVFELVAGEGQNYAAMEAPALGSAGGVTLPNPPAERAQTPPAAEPEASPIQAAPEEPAKPASKPAAKPASKAAKPVDLLKELKRVQERRERTLEARYQKAKEAEEKRLAQEAKAAARSQRIDAEGIREGVLGGSTSNKEGGAGGKALSREEMNLLDAYFAELKQSIKGNHTPPEGVSDSLAAQVEFMVAVDGSLSHVRIIKSSGNLSFDESVVEACEHTRSVGPRPDGKSDTVKMTFKMQEDESP